MIPDDMEGLGRKKKEDLYQAYKAVIAKYGKAARHMSRSSLYEEAANSIAPSFYVSGYRAGIIINEKIKEETTRNVKGESTCDPGRECQEAGDTV